MKVVGYIRTSTDRQDLSPDAQREAIQRKATYEGWDVVWVRDTCSGSQRLGDRPGGAYALSLLDSGEARKLVVAKLDRLSRSVLDLSHVIERSNKQGWGLVMLDFDGVDTSTSTGKLVAGILVQVAEFERERISERIRDALAEKKRAGWVPGPSPDPLPDDVRDRILALRAEGLSPQRIADTLNEEGVPTTRGRRWHHSSVRNVLRREAVTT